MTYTANSFGKVCLIKSGRDQSALYADILTRHLRKKS